MKRVIIGLMLCMFLIGLAGLVVAENNGDNGTIGGQRDEHGCLTPAGYSWNETEQKCVKEWENGEDRYQANETDEYENETDGSNNTNQGLGQTIRNRVHAGVYTSPEGVQIRVSEMAQNRITLKTDDSEAECAENCNLTEEKIQNKSVLKMHLKNGNSIEIKIMPDVANERALERLKLKVCNPDNNCTIQLKEVGQGDQAHPVYEVQVERHYKLLGLFQTKAINKAQVDAETGDTVVVKKPWWSFLATSSD